MSTVIKLKNVTFNNPALPIVDTSKHPAQFGLVAEYDMLTFNSATVMKDLSGNGKHATFNAAPTLNSYGWVGTGDCRALTGVTDLGSNMSGFLVCRVTDINQTDGRFYLSNWGQFSGGLLHPNGAAGSRKFGWQQGGGTSQYQSDLAEDIVDDKWYLMYFYIGAGGAANLKNLTDGTAGTTPIASGATSNRQWVIGGGYSPSSETVASQWDLAFGEIAYCGLYNKVLTANQEAYLKDYVASKVLSRGIVV